MSNPARAGRLPRPIQPTTDHREDAIPARSLARPIALAAVVAWGVSGGSAPFRVAAQVVPSAAACPQGRISEVFIDNHSIYDLEQVEREGFVRGVYRLANTLHVKTRESFIRKELLFGVGDCYDPFVLEESGRILRGYGFLARADVFAVDQPDGSKHVVVDTQDEWTTKISVGLSFESGLDLESLSLTEENLAGRGILGAAFLRQRQERRDIGGRLELPRLFGSRTDAALAAGRTRIGSFVEQSVTYPFVGELGRLGVRQAFRRRDEIFPYAVGGALGAYSHVLLAFVDERVEASVAGRIGRPGNLTVLGMGLSRETMAFGSFPADLEVAQDGDFGNPAPAPPGTDSLIAGQVRESSTTHLNIFVGQRNLRFQRARGLDNLNGIQDIQLGTDVGLTLGRSVDVLTTGSGESPDELFARLRVFAGLDPGTSFVFLNGGLEGRQVFSGSGGRQGWRDVIGELDVYSYIRSRTMPGHTFVARLSGAGGWSMDTPFQVTLGGREALRGLREEDFPGGRRLLATLEDRIFLGWPAPDVLDFGVTVFAEAGRVWGGDAPFGADSGWKGSVGIGLRLGFPEGTRGVARLDLAVPIGLENTRSPIFRVTLHEGFGLIRGFEDTQLTRSRRITVGPDSFTGERRR